MILLALAAAGAGADAGTGPLAACMWMKMPTTAAAFVAEQDRTKGFSLMMRAAAPCGEAMPARLDLKKLKAALVATRPTAIGPDTQPADNVAVCTAAADGRMPECRPAGE